QTAPRTAAMNYAVKLPELTDKRRTAGTLPQERTIDVRADLTGVETEWRDSSERWTGWLPHLDSGVAQNLTRASAEHQRLFELMRHPGTLKMRAQLDLWLMLHPATQPGSTLDFEYPRETVTLV